MRAPPPRLLYVGGFEFPTAQARGIQSLHTAHALARAGWGVRVLAQRPGWGQTRRSTVEALAGYGLAPHRRLQIVPLPLLRLDRLAHLEIHARLAVANWSYGLLCLADLLRCRPRPDLVLARDPRLAWMFLRTRSLHRRPVIYEVHEIFSTRPRDNRSLDPADIWGVADRTRRLERAVFAEADLLAPLTRCSADLLRQEHGVEAWRIAAVPDGTMSPEGGLPRRGPGGREVVYAGQLYSWKGVDVLLRAVARLPDVTLSVLGGLSTRDGTDPDLARCRALAERLGIGGRVTFHGFVPHARVRGRLEGAAAGVVPLPDRLMSRYFTSPLKVFDYMAAGVPIVASDLPALREVLTDEENALLVTPDEPDGLARAIERLLGDPALADRLRRRAFADVAAYTWDRRAERIIEAVRRVVGGSHDSPASRASVY